MYKKYILAFIIAISSLTAFTGQAEAAQELGSIEFNISSLFLNGDYKSYFSDLKKSYGNDSLSAASFRAAAWLPVSLKAEIGLDFAVFGENKAYGNNSKETDNIKSTGAGIKFNFAEKKLNNKNTLRIYGKAGAGMYIRKYNYDIKHNYQLFHGKKSQYSSGYNFGLGANLFFDSNMYLGLEYRIDKMSESSALDENGLSYKMPPFHASSLGINIGYRFTGFLFSIKKITETDEYGDTYIYSTQPKEKIKTEKTSVPAPAAEPAVQTDKTDAAPKQDARKPADSKPETAKPAAENTETAMPEPAKPEAAKPKAKPSKNTDIKPEKTEKPAKEPSSPAIDDTVIYPDDSPIKVYDNAPSKTDTKTADDTTITVS